MNIAMLSAHTSPIAMLGGKETGGMNVYVRELSRELAQRGHRVDVFTRVEDPAVPVVEQDGLGPGGRVIHLPLGPTPYDKRRAFDYLPEFVRGFQDFAARDGARYAIYHAHYWLSGWVARALQASEPAPIVQMFHTLGMMKSAVARTQVDRETECRREVEALIMRVADRVVASTPRDREQMIELYDAPGDNIVVIPPGVDLNLFHPIAFATAREYVGAPKDPDHIMVVFVGRIDPVKGIDIWFRAMALVVEETPELRENMCVCIIGGDLDEEAAPDNELARLMSLKDELGIGDMVTFLGRRDQQSLPYYYSAADVVVMPSLYESFGMAALEAMACGTPVVASNVGGLSYLVRDRETGFLVPDRSPRALAGCLGHLLRQPELRRRFGARGVEVAREYAWPRIADQVEDLYGSFGQNGAG